jgi:hypothetical protein
MGTVLFTWELGGGLGHLMLISPIAKALLAGGHRVVLAVKDVAATRRCLGDCNIELLATPRSQFAIPFPRQETHAHLLANIGFNDSTVLKAHADVWKTVYRTLQPDLIVFVNSPVALLAAQSVPARKAIMGLGFFIPPDAYPLPAFRPDEPLDWKKINEVEDGLLHRANTLLQAWHEPPLQRMAQLYTRIDELFLATYPEFDHFPNRGPIEYWGPINAGHLGGKDPVWPTCAGKKIFAYVRNFAALPQLLQALKDSSQPTIFFAEGMDQALLNHFKCDSFRFELDRLNIEKVTAQCDLAITHASLTTTAMILKAGKPVLVVPVTEEQGIVARRIHLSGAGLGVLPDQPAQFAPRLRLLLQDDRYREGAKHFAEKLGRIDLEQKQREIVERLGAMLPNGSCDNT